MNKTIKFITAVLVCEGVGILGSILTIPSINTWYQALNKPSFSPPNWIFGPVWTTLYFLMGVAIFLILDKKITRAKNNILILFSLLLFLNFLWSNIFFGLHLPLWAFIEIIFLWINILLLVILFWKYSKPASILLVPYLLWVSFASLLNLSIVILNK